MSNQRGGPGPPQFAGRPAANPFNAHSVDIDYDPITVDELVPAVPATAPRGGGYQQAPQGAWGAPPQQQQQQQGGGYQQPPQQQQQQQQGQGSYGQAAPVPFAASTTNAYASGNMAKEGRPGYGPTPPPTLFSAGPAAPPPPPGNGSNMFGDTGASSSGGGGGGGGGHGGGAPPGSAPLPDPATFAYWNIRRYRPYFDVDTRDVLWRVANSLYGLFKADFMEVTMSRPDLYGPFWISTTLIFVTAVAGNFANYISWFRDNHLSPPPMPPFPPPYPPNTTFSPPPTAAAAAAVVVAQWFADYTKLSVSIAMFYGYTFLLSFILFCALRYFKSEMQLVNVWCIYGYAMTIFLPVSLGCIVPIEWLRWLLVGLATTVSGLFLVMNFRATIYAIAPAKAVIALIVVALCHVGMGLGLKLYFFRY